VRRYSKLINTANGEILTTLWSLATRPNTKKLVKLKGIDVVGIRSHKDGVVCYF
jgi:hypothetical protein